MRKIFIFISVLLFLSLSHTKALYAESDCSNIETNPTELTQNRALNFASGQHKF